MPKKKGGKKGKKKGEEGPEILTTQEILQERAVAMCPRLGDHYEKLANVEMILEDVAEKTILKCARRMDDSLNLAVMKLAELPLADVFESQLAHITELNLARNKLFNGDALFEALVNLKQLKKLNLSENYLNGPLSPHACELAGLQELRLDKNRVSTLPASCGAWTGLRVLTISDNALTELPPQCTAWTELTYFNVKNNKITDLPGDFIKFWEKLERLYCGGNKIKVVPEEISFCSHLTEMDFSNNVIEEVPMGIAMCSQLNLLHFGNNKISLIAPEIFCMLTNIQELQLYKNKLTSIPPEIGNLVGMKRLSLSSNNLKTLPDEIGACTSLKELYINNNAKFSMLPGAAGHLRMLQELSLRKCPAFKALPSSAADMTSLRELDVRAPKKQVCKITPEVADLLKAQSCMVRGGIIKKGKGGGKKK